jgi:hypothetical protein
MTHKPKMRLYYMHPVNTYNTSLEQDQLVDIRRKFGRDWEVVNPNAPEHQVAYDDMKQKTGNGMAYFVALADGCQTGVYLPFRDGKIGAGIAAEIRSLLARGCQVWELRHDRRFFRHRELDEKRVLSIEETRARIRNADGSSKPY